MRFEDTLGISHDLSQLVHEMRLCINERLAPFGLTTPKYAALSVLEAKGAMTNADLARECSVTAQTMNRIIKDLEAGGFVKKQRDNADGLKQPLALTRKAEKVICNAHVAVNDLELAMVKGWSKAEINALRDIVQRSYDNLLQLPDPSAGK
jgi:DNA-binding MarR family transcriptional regulator